MRYMYVLCGMAASLEPLAKSMWIAERAATPLGQAPTGYVFAGGNSGAEVSVRAGSRQAAS